jgi:hypothetical protein
MTGEPSISSLVTLNPCSYYFRFRNMPTFGPTIRKLPKKVSELSKLAAQDYEDILQVILCYMTA